MIVVNKKLKFYPGKDLDKFQFVWMLNIDLTTYPEWGQKVSTYFLMVNKIE